MSTRAVQIRQAILALNFKGTLNKTQDQATVFHPGLSYGDIHGKVPSIWSLMKLVEGTRFFAHHGLSPEDGENLLQYDKLTEDRMMFMGSTVFNVDEAMYNLSLVKSPLVAKLNLNHVGNSSLSSMLNLFTNDSEQRLLSNINQVVSIDFVTRKPNRLPDWWSSKYASSARSDRPMNVQSETKPDNAHVHEFRVDWSATDFYKHTNWTSYVKYCIDAAYVAVSGGNMKFISAETVSYNAIKSLRVRYIGESLLGDTLNVFTWETPGAENTLKFQVTKEDNLICFVILEYYSPSLFQNLI